MADTNLVQENGNESASYDEAADESQGKHSGGRSERYSSRRSDGRSGGHFTPGMWVSYSVSTIMVALRNFLITWLTASIGSEVLNAVNEGKAEDFFRQMAVRLLLILAFLVFDTTGIFWQSVTIHRIRNGLRSLLYEKILRARYDQVHRMGQKGELLSRLNGDVETVSSILSYGILTPLMFLISGVGATFTIAAIHWKLCVLIYVAGLICWGYQFSIIRRERRTIQQLQENKAQALGICGENFQNALMVRLCSLMDALEEKVLRNLMGLEQISRKYACQKTAEGFGSTLLQYLQSVGMLFAGFFLYKKGEIRMGDIVILYQMAGLIINMITTVSSSYASIQSWRVGFSRLRDILDLEEERDAAGAEEHVFGEDIAKVEGHVFGEDIAKVEGHVFREDMTGAEGHVFSEDIAKIEEHAFSEDITGAEEHVFGEDIAKAEEHVFGADAVKAERHAPESDIVSAEEWAFGTHAASTKGAAFDADGDAADTGISAQGILCRLGDVTIHENLCLNLERRGLYVMAGESGRGKTTIFRLLTGIYPYEAGVLKLFGRDKREYTTGSVRSQITYMTQENALFQGTIRDNILWRSEMPDSEIMSLLKRLGLDQWIASLPDGLDTRISNGGTVFSGGQRKCLLLARALAEVSPVYLLDEPFAGVDERHGELIWKELARIAEHALVVVIAHDQWVQEERMGCRVLRIC